jgi:endonuclease G
MLQRKFVFTIVVFGLLFYSCQSPSYLHNHITTNQGQTPNIIVLKHDCITIGYDIEAKQSTWVAYTLKKSDLEGDAKRKNNFKIDPKLSEKQSAKDEDYYKSGYDRGHLAPAADMTVSQECMDQSFFYSNISPQLPGHNRGVWKRLESDVRDWAVKYDSILVVTGAIVDKENDERLGDSKVCVPKLYYKALLIKKESEIYAIGFVVANESSKEDITTFSITIDALEIQTGLDFFPSFSQKEQAEFESKIEQDIWFEVAQ